MSLSTEDTSIRSEVEWTALAEHGTSGSGVSDVDRVESPWTYLPAKGKRVFKVNDLQNRQTLFPLQVHNLYPFCDFITVPRYFLFLPKTLINEYDVLR